MHLQKMSVLTQSGLMKTVFEARNWPLHTTHDTLALSDLSISNISVRIIYSSFFSPFEIIKHAQISDAANLANDVIHDSLRVQ